MPDEGVIFGGVGDGIIVKGQIWTSVRGASVKATSRPVKPRFRNGGGA